MSGLVGADAVGDMERARTRRQESIMRPSPLYEPPASDWVVEADFTDRAAEGFGCGRRASEGGGSGRFLGSTAGRGGGALWRRPPTQMPCWSSPLPRREGSWRRATGWSRMSMVTPGAMRIGGGRRARRKAAQATWRRAKSRRAFGWVPGGTRRSATPSAKQIRSARRRVRGGGDDAVGEERVHPGRSGGGGALFARGRG